MILFFILLSLADVDSSVLLINGISRWPFIRISREVYWKVVRYAHFIYETEVLCEEDVNLCILSRTPHLLFHFEVRLKILDILYV